MKNSYACYGTFPYLIVSTSLAGRVSDGTDDRWFLSVARDCLFFKVSRLSLEGTQPSVEGKRGGLPRESNRSEAWSGILAFTSVEVESAWSFTTRPLLLHGVVLNKVPAQLTVPYALPINVFIYIYIYIYISKFCHANFLLCSCEAPNFTPIWNRTQSYSCSAVLGIFKHSTEDNMLLTSTSSG